MDVFALFVTKMLLKNRSFSAVLVSFINLKTTREGYRNEKEGSFKAKYGEVYEIRNNVRSSIFDNQVIYVSTLNKKLNSFFKFFNN